MSSEGRYHRHSGCLRKPPGIDQHPDSAQARREKITGSSGERMWKVSVRSSVDDLAVLWSRGSAGDYVEFVGAMPIAR